MDLHVRLLEHVCLLERIWYIFVVCINIHVPLFATYFITIANDQTRQGLGLTLALGMGALFYFGTL